MPRISAATRPPTITIANGRCESEPMPLEIAAGQQADARDQHRHHDRPQPPDRCRRSPRRESLSPRARSWLMYSSMMTPVCTETPKSARKPTPDETLMCVPVASSASKPPSGAIATFAMINSTHFTVLNMVKRIMQITRSVIGTTMHQAPRRSLRAFIFAGPIDL